MLLVLPYSYKHLEGLADRKSYLGYKYHSLEKIWSVINFAGPKPVFVELGQFFEDKSQVAFFRRNTITVGDFEMPTLCFYES